MRSFWALLVIAFSSSICYANGDISFINYTNANYAHAVLVEGNDYLWVGSGGGVVRWNLKNNTYQNYLNSDGLSDNSVSSILIDNEGKNGLPQTTASVAMMEYPGLDISKRMDYLIITSRIWRLIRTELSGQPPAAEFVLSMECVGTRTRSRMELLNLW